MQRARNTVDKCLNNYLRTIDRFFVQLGEFVEKTQEKWSGAAAASESVATVHNRLKCILPAPDVSSKEIVTLIKSKYRWRFHDVFRIVRALFYVGFGRGGGKTQPLPTALFRGRHSLPG